MKTVVKILLEFDTPDTPAARRRFRQLAEEVVPHLPPDAVVRDFKMVEQGSGRQVESLEKMPDAP